MNSSLPPSAEVGDLDPAKLPAHVAIIMDGNGRWAKQRLMNRVKGHERGVETVRVIVRTCREIGIRVLTLYAFSTENWQRPKREIDALMGLLKRFLRNELAELHQQDIRVNAIGQVDRLPEGVGRVLGEAVERTRDNGAMILNLALSYGGRSEILQTVRRIAGEVAAGRLSPDAISEDDIADRLDTAGMPDPDLLIRTSGEMRISNFLLWQIAYTEIFITDTLWPDFSREEFLGILKRFESRERRFGAVAKA